MHGHLNMLADESFWKIVLSLWIVHLLVISLLTSVLWSCRHRQKDFQAGTNWWRSDLLCPLLGTLKLGQRQRMWSKQISTTDFRVLKRTLLAGGSLLKHSRSSAHWSQRSENPLRLWQKRALSCFYEGNRLRAALRFSMVSAVRFDYWNTTVDSTEMSHLIRMLKLIKPQGHPSRTMWQLPLYQAALLLVLYARNTQFLVLSWQPSKSCSTHLRSWKYSKANSSYAQLLLVSAGIVSLPVPART